MKKLAPHAIPFGEASMKCSCSTSVMDGSRLDAGAVGTAGDPRPDVVGVLRGRGPVDASAGAVAYGGEEVEQRRLVGVRLRRGEPVVVVSRSARTHGGMVVGERRGEEEDPLAERLHGRRTGEEREKQEEDPLAKHLHGRRTGEERRGRFTRLQSADDRSHGRPRHVLLRHGSQVEAAARQGGLRDPPPCVAETREE
jgi:hypothetical protein